MMNTITKVLASGLGTGYSPVASGTVGSLLALALYWLVSGWSVSALIVMVAVTFLVCVPVSTKAERLYGGKDDSHIVIDEFIGMWVSLFFLPHTLKVYAAAFVLFRVYDVRKPFFVHKVQEWPGGWGVVADDVLAGIFANISVRLLMLLPFFK
jgi:phosphatidylglycerophosphatase A